MENTLDGLSGVVEAVVGQPCPVLANATASTPPRCRPSAEGVAALRGAALADYKVPETFSFSAEPLPCNANGKLMNRCCASACPADAKARQSGAALRYLPARMLLSFTTFDQRGDFAE